MIVQIEQVDLAVGVVTDFGDGLFCIGEELIFAVKDGDRFDAIERGLNAERGCRAACAQNGHFFADDINALFFERAHIAGAIGNVAGQYAIVVHHGIHRANQFCRRRELVQILANLRFVRHGDVTAAQF